MDPHLSPSRASVGRGVAVALLALALAVLVGGCDLGGSSGAPSGSASPGGGSGFGSGGPIGGPTSSTASAPLVAFAPDGPTVEARVDRVVDGDTIIVIVSGQRQRLRYIGIDTPESVKPDTPVERMGREATAANEVLVEGRTVVLETDVSETDRFGRLLRDVWVERDGVLVLVNLELVRMGFAYVTTFPPDVKYADRLLVALNEARAAGVGLWGPRQAP